MSSKTSAPDDAQLAKSIANAQQQMDRRQLTSIEAARDALKQREAELTAAGGSDANTAELKKRAARYATLAAALDDARLALVRLPKPAEASFILHGRVVDARGKPRQGLSVSVSDAKGIVNQRAAPVKTDATGYFTITLRAGEFPELTADSSQLFVSVKDASGREVAMPKEAVPYRPGKVGIMPIVT